MAGGGQVTDQAFVTLATNDTYALGALVLAHSLRRAGTTRQLAIMVTPGVTQGIRQQLSQVFNLVQNVDVLDSRDQVNLALLTRPDLGITFTKFHCWRLTQYSKCVFLDADTLVLSNVDDLFEREELSAAPDAGWPDCFNSGVFVFRPSDETYQALLQFAVSQGSFDGGDQGLLNMYFSDWATKDIARHLPFIYNCVSQAFYSYMPAFKFYGKNVKIVHFIGSAKPWHHAFNTGSGQVEVSGEAGNHKQFLQLWWQIFMECIQPNIDPGLYGNFVFSAANYVTIGCIFFLKWPRLKVFMATYMKLSQAMKLWLKDKSKSNSRLARLIRLIWQPSSEYDKHEKDVMICTSYVPPEVQIYYEQPEGKVSPTLVYVDNRQDRPFTFFETFYSEPPMTSKEEYPTPQGAYDAKFFEQELLEFIQSEGEIMAHEQTPQPLQPQPAQEDETQHFHGQIDQSHHAQREAEWKKCDEEAKQAEEARRSEIETKQKQADIIWQNTSTCQSSCASGGRDSETETQSESESSNAAGSACVSLSDHSGAASANGVGIQEGVAKIGTFSLEELQDPNRRYQWEKGQIDYTGIDSFDNIQKRLQQMMSSKEEAESVLGPIAGEPPKPQEPQVPLTPSGKPLKPAIKQPAKMQPAKKQPPRMQPAKPALKK